MKKLVLLILPVLFLISCKKTVEKAQEKAVIDAMTTGFWKVTKFEKGATDVKGSFLPYKFQFKDNNTVDAINNNTTERTGSWKGDTNALTIEANFGNVGEPLLLLNGVWKITNSGWNFVEANRTEGTELRILRLDKE
jgi:hypothetical protein